MQVANSKNFISMLSEDKPVVCFYYKKEDEAQVKKIKEALLKIEKSLTLLPLYEFVTNDNPDNERLCEEMGIVDRPLLVVYKEGCFNRYKDKQFTEDAILQFLGNKKIYMPKEKSQKISESDIDV